MKYLNESATREEIFSRLNKLNPESKALWGKMNVSQMLSHCNCVIEVPIGLREPKSNILGFLLGPYIKRVILSNKNFKPNLPTSPNFIGDFNADFNESKKLLTDHINTFSKLPMSELAKRKHPIGGKFSGEEWAWSQYKHLDHHFRQFGV